MTPKRERFVEEYLVDCNGAAAAVRAGYSPRRAKQTARDLLLEDEVSTAIHAAMQARSERLEITQDRVLAELALIGFSDLEHYTVDAAGRVVAADDAPAGATRALASIKRKVRTYERGGETVEEVDVEIKAWNKNAALQDLGKHLGLFGPRGTADDPQQVKVILERVTRAADADANGPATDDVEASDG